jgi:hypothetical protein
VVAELVGLSYPGSSGEGGCKHKSGPNVTIDIDKLTSVD